MALRIVATVKIVDDTPNPDVTLVPESGIPFNFNVATGTELRQKLVDALAAVRATSAATTAQLDAALAAATL